ncbi:transmembrane protein 203-like [Branchiostoma floridae x Branchiostoma japonicum]|uniref:MGC14327-like protein n=1 Tax=Branchiostoma floridae TaxID=7739 RepID=Q71BB4_BRAFL|nr:MGC14327-like protein [Branchiostoma floridae]
MLFSLKEIIQWIGLSAFELWLHVVSLLVFSILLALKLEGVLSTTWWTVFIPLFASDGLHAYFSSIVFLRLNLEGDLRTAGIRTAWSAVVLVLLFAFKMLLCQKLEDQNNLTFAMIMSPVFILLQVLMIRACQVGN